MNGNYLQTPSGSLVNSPSALLLQSLGGGGGLNLGGILPILLALLPSLLGGGDDEAKQFERAMQMKNMLRQLGFKQPYQSPYTSNLDRIVYEMLTRGMGRANFGWPEGFGIDLSFLEGLPSAGLGRRIRKS